MTHDDVRTVDEVRRWLPRDIGDTIAMRTPCADGGRHDWDHDRTEVHQWGRAEPVLIFESWQCRGCGLRVQYDPKGCA